MPTFLVRAEVHNLADSVYDSNDLSTIRGGAIAALRVFEGVEVALRHLGDAKPVQQFSGASKCSYVTMIEDRTASEIENAIRKTFAEWKEQGREKQPFSYLTVAVAAEAFQGHTPPGILAKKLEAKCLSQRFRSWTLVPEYFYGTTLSADPLQRIRGGLVRVALPAGKHPVLPIDVEESTPALSNGQSEQHLLSPMVAARRTYGRAERRGFYNRQIEILKGKDAVVDAFGAGGSNSYSFTDSIEDMVVDAPAGLPLSVRNSVAVVYADGNGFGEIFASMPDSRSDLIMKPLRGDLLRNILLWLQAGARSEIWQAFAVKPMHPKDRLLGMRFEVILWGGDEMAFVMPSWLALPFVERLLKWLGGWKVDEVPLRHSVGVAIGNRKTPVRQLRQVAKSIADANKSVNVLSASVALKSENSVGIEVFESLAPPDDDLDQYRRNLYFSRQAQKGADLSALAGQLAIPGDQFSSFMDQMEGLVLSGPDGRRVARSQFYKVLRTLRKEDIGLAEAGADTLFRAHFDDYIARAGDGKLTLEDLELADFSELDGTLRRTGPISCAMIVTLWDYVDVLGGAIRKAVVYSDRKDA